MSDKPQPVDYALKYAAFGFQVFPVYVFQDGDTGKWIKRPPRPIVLGSLCPAHQGLSGGKGSPNDKKVRACANCRGGHHVATTDPAEVRRQFASVKRGVVAVLPPPGVLILDDDSSVFDPIWYDRPHVRTASGKRHYYFRLGPGQEPIHSENLIQYGSEPEELLDVRCAGDDRWICVPCGRKQYVPRNGWRIEPDTYPVLPQNVYERLLSAPRASGGGGGGGPVGKYSPGVAAASVGNVYDRDREVVEQWLSDAGWTTDDTDRWTRPGGTDGFGRLTEKGGVWFFNVHTDNDEFLRGGHWYTASMLRCVFEHSGNWKKCYLALWQAGAFGMEEAME